MSKDLKIYHNPRCTKSRLTLQLLHNKGYNPEIIEYLTIKLNKAELSEILDMLKMEPRDIMRRKEPEYKANNLDDPKLTRDSLIEAIIKNPSLLERPIVVKGNKAAIGRPPENVLEIL